MQTSRPSKPIEGASSRESILALVLGSLAKAEGQRERFSFPSSGQSELSKLIQARLEEDRRCGRTEGLLDLVRLARVLDLVFESPTAARVLYEALVASGDARAILANLDAKEDVFRDACEKYAGTARTLPSANLPARAEGIGQTIRAALLMKPGDLDARRARPSFLVQRLKGPTPSEDTSTPAREDQPQEARRVRLRR